MLQRDRDVKVGGDTPLFRQYQGVKEQHPDKLLFFRMGDFYEMFYDDAQRAAALLGITLTQRKTAGEPIPMAGVPCHSVDQYISRLIRIGESVVICDQVGEPSGKGKGLMERKVTQVVTPGTLTDQSLLPARSAAVAMAIAPGKKMTGYAWLDLARGELRAGECDKRSLPCHAARIQPAELLLPEGGGVPANLSVVVHHLPEWEFSVASSHHRMCDHFGVRDLRGFGLEGKPQAVAAAMALLSYAERVQCQSLKHLWQVGFENVADHVAMAGAVRHSLELSVPLVKGGPTLHSVLDECATSMGSRMLLRRLHNPLQDRQELTARQALVAAVAGPAPRLAVWLRGSCDLERVVTRVVLGSVRPRELDGIRDVVVRLPQLRDILAECDAAVTTRLTAIWNEHGEVRQLLTSVLAEKPPAQLRDGGVIAPGCDSTLDDLRQLADGSSEALVQIELRERQATGLAALRVGHNRVHGYYLEVPRVQGDMVPDTYRRLQTIKHAERFVTDELRRLEAAEATALDRAAALERSLYATLVTDLQRHSPGLRQLAEALAELDVTSNLARLAHSRKWVRPTYVDEPVVDITGGRHPVVEGTVDHFVPNDTQLAAPARMQVLTGPNMGGKSTYMRQVALIVLLAHIGSPVPAMQARVGRIDSIHTRIGSADDLAGGRSTFMVEMAETAAILNTAGSASLVVLDEIGRGTSTFDGLSLAWAAATALLDNNKSLVLLATHYLEMAELAAGNDAVSNVHMAVGEEGGEVTMLYRVEAEPANRSFGLQVARMAGIPAHALAVATRKLKQLEDKALAGGVQAGLFTSTAVQPVVASPVLERLRGMIVDDLTPRQALALLYELQVLAEDR